MRFFYEWFFPALWVAFFFYWQIAARGAKSNERVEPLVSRIVKEATFGLAIVILMSRGLLVPVLYRFYLPTTYWAVWFWIGAAVNVLGFGLGDL